MLSDILDELDGVVRDARANNSALGIFPAMYRTVTAGVKEAVRTDFFDHNDAMEHLSVVFADRYLDAYRAMENGVRPTESWHVAFDAATDGKRRMVVQHLLAGMTAHINLDLGIAAAAVANGDAESMYVDFFRVNQMLYEQVNEFQQMLNSVSFKMRWIDAIGRSFDERLAKIGIGGARERAWFLAMDLIDDGDHAERIITERDLETAHIARLVVDGVLSVRTISRIVARTEPSDIGTVIDAFLEPSVDLEAVEATVQAADTQPPLRSR